VADHSIDVTFDYNDGNPKWTFEPESVVVPNKEHAKLFWHISPKSSPGTQFAATNGIIFKPTAPGYPGSAPEPQNNTKYVSSEFNDNPGPNAQKFAYVANVVYNKNPYQSPDPDVTNDPPGHMGDPDHSDPEEHDSHDHGSRDHDAHGGNKHGDTGPRDR
jgi:hypothetical protein